MSAPNKNTIPQPEDYAPFHMESFYRMEKETCDIADLQYEMARHVDKGEFLDAGIFAMFIHARQCAEYLEASAEVAS